MKSYLKFFYKNISIVSEEINIGKIELIINDLIRLRKRNGRLIMIGVGGSAANCSHAVNDFRKICNIQAINPLDNVSEFSARINDDGWESFFVKWMKTSKINKNDQIFILSVGGGNRKRKISMNIVRAIEFAKKNQIKINGIVGKNDGEAYKKGQNIILIPIKNNDLITPLSESFQSIILHSIIFSPKLKINKSKW